MNIKQALLIALISLFINGTSLYNATLAVWSLVLLIFSIFLLNSRDSNRLPQDKKIFGIIQFVMLCVIFFLSSVMGIVGFLQLWFIINEFFSPIIPLSIGLTIIGTIIYYYLLIKLTKEAYGIIQQNRKTGKNTVVQHIAKSKEEEASQLETGESESKKASSSMKARYIILLAFLSLVVNFLSVYNLYLGICSIFLLLIVSITALFVTLVNRANKVDQKKRNHVIRNFAEYGVQKPTQVTNKIAIIFGLILVYVGAVFFTIFQRMERPQLHQFLTTHIQIENVHSIANALSILGYILFIVALLLGTFYCIRAMRREQVFTGK